MANNDRIYEAYIGGMGASFQQETRKRIDWIVNQVTSNKTILDIGCSQGIVSLLLAEKENQVVGVDIQDSSIVYAKNLLATEYKHLCDRVEFHCSDIMNFHSERQFDYIILTEVIEHIEQPLKALSYIKGFLKQEGKLIITIPLGLCNHPDHKEIYYLTNLSRLIEPLFTIEKLEFIGSWIGVECNIKEQLNLNLADYYSLEEQAIKEKEEHLNNRLTVMKNDLEEANSKYKKSCENYEVLKKWYRDSLDKCKHLEESIDKDKEEYTVMKNDLEEANSKYKKSCENYEVLKNVIEKTNQRFVELHNIIEANKNEIKQAILDNNKKESYILKLSDENKKLVQQLEEKTHHEEKYVNELTSCFNELTEQEEVLKELKQQMKQLERENVRLLSMDAESNRKLNIITKSKVGRIGIRIYHVFSRLKRRVSK